MRKLVVSEFVSLDGVMEAPGGDDGYVHGPWTVPYWGEDIGAYKAAEVAAAQGMLLGRRTYEGFAAAWPERGGDDFADKMNAMEKYVVSSTLGSVDWQNSRLLTGDMAASVRELKAGDGGDILVAGSASLVHGLLEADLVDELRLAIYPLTLGVGRRLFPEGTRLDFDVAEITTSATGVILTSYVRGEGRGDVEFDYDRMKTDFD